jgi:TIR domain-containing protein
VNIFLSYPSDERDTAERLNYALIEQGHDVFFDRADLPAGFEFDQRIASAIADSDLIVFLITPTAVVPGRYTLTEMDLAEERWPKPSGRTLPVMLRPTELTAIPGYLRAVNIFTPRGDAVAEIAHEVRKLAGGRSLTTRFGHRLRSRAGLALVVAIVALSAFAWIMRPWEGGAAGRRSVTLPLAVRQHARAAAAMADSGFVIATSNPPQLVRFSESGVQIGEPVDLMGDPVAVTRTPGRIVVATRGRDGVMVFDSKRLRLADSVELDPTTVKPPYRFVNPPRRSGDIQSVAAYDNGDLWVTTGDRDGEPTVLRYRNYDSTWEVATFTADTAGFGTEANGVRLRRINGDLWGVRARGDTSTVYHFLGFIRIDRFDGKDRAIVRCAHDIAPAPPKNLLLLSCENELQEIYADASVFTLVRSRPTLPPDRTLGTTSYDLLERDSTNVIVALNTAGAAPNGKPVRGRVAEVDSAGNVRRFLDVRDAVVQSLGVTSRSVVVVLRRADGSMDVEVVPRNR